MSKSLLRRLFPSLLLAISCAAFGQTAPAPTRPSSGYFSPVARDIYSRITLVTKLSESDVERISIIMQLFDREYEAAQRDLRQKWFARQTPPSPQEVAAENALIAAGVARLEDKYFELIAQHVLSADQRSAVDAEQIAFRALASFVPTKEQQSKAYAMAQEIVRQITEPSDRPKLMAARVAALQARVDGEILTADQRTAKASGRRSDEGAATSPASQVATQAGETRPANPGQLPMRYHDNQTTASNAGQINLSLTRLVQIEPMLASPPPAILSDASHSYWMGAVSLKHVWFGDSRAAVVVDTNPLLVASYSDDLDAVVVLQFPQWLVKEHHLETGAKLGAVNTFVRDRPVGTDIVRGPKALHDYKNVLSNHQVDFADRRSGSRAAKSRSRSSDEEWRGIAWNWAKPTASNFLPESATARRSFPINPPNDPKLNSIAQRSSTAART